MRPLHRRALALPAAVGLLTAAGCVSTSDIESIQIQLDEIQRHVLQIQQQAPSKDEVQGIEAQVGRQTEALLKSEADMQVELKQLITQIESLRAQLEDTNYRLTQVSQAIAKTQQELIMARRASPEAPVGKDGGGSAGALSADPAALYQAAYSDYTQGNYDLAIQTFQEYLRNFAETDLADNATYWIGESHYRQGIFRRAIDQFQLVLKRYPRSDKLPSALLKKGYAHLELGESQRGVSELQKVSRDYPTSDEANLARQRLRELGVDAR